MSGPLVVSSREALAEHLARELIYTGGDPYGLLAPSFRAHMFNDALDAVDKALASGVVVEAATIWDEGWKQGAWDVEENGWESHDLSKGPHPANPYRAADRGAES